MKYLIPPAILAWENLELGYCRLSVSSQERKEDSVKRSVKGSKSENMRTIRGNNRGWTAVSLSDASPQEVTLGSKV